MYHYSESWNAATEMVTERRVWSRDLGSIKLHKTRFSNLTSSRKKDAGDGALTTGILLVRKWVCPIVTCHHQFWSLWGSDSVIDFISFICFLTCRYSGNRQWGTYVDRLLSILILSWGIDHFTLLPSLNLQWNSSTLTANIPTRKRTICENLG